MAILTNAETRAIIQGITGNVGRSFARRFLAAGTPLVGGVTPGRGGQEIEGLPVFDSCHEAVAARGANTSFVVVPAPFVLDACYEAIDAGIRLMVLYIENIPLLDAMRMTAYARAKGAVILGPNSAGCITVGGANLSELDPVFLKRGPIGVVAKSGAMCAESAHYLAECGFGCTTIVSIGGDPVIGTTHGDVLELFEADPETRGIVMVGEIGGRSEVEAATVLKRMTKPVVAVIIGGSAPPGRQMGHAGAWQGEGEENAPEKRRLLSQAGAVIAADVTEVGAMMRKVFKE
ncbi:MAG: succinate--CoA ligase subunit alpha [Alphaproteobacteria bacterium]